MISKEKAKVIIENYIKNKKLPYIELLNDVNKINLKKNNEIAYGKKKGETTDVYTYRYVIMGVQDKEGQIVYIDAKTGELLYILTHHWYIDIED
ncbi:hypothetical protein FIA58_007645 [Flavobacterium jejuense]|uniref:PepSY domain-containing protein n=1 Tax=Flavobacterium jejuense TaxID=1544455 RepID=A0ABX0IP12_9FLAO|nr:hypothetical protein [Flavobacterium jejuense]NHN25547.1 hypothetical protein [Flavobacterium jejuense]